MLHFEGKLTSMIKTAVINLIGQISFLIIRNSNFSMLDLLIIYGYSSCLSTYIRLCIQMKYIHMVFYKQPCYCVLFSSGNLWKLNKYYEEQ